jgi:general secretion pathway protein I
MPGASSRAPGPPQNGVCRCQIARRRASAPAGTGSPSQRGFSLLEVIAAVLLLAITFATLMRVAGSSLNLTARAAERSEAAMWARSLLDSAYVLEPPRIGASSGRFDTRYQWRLNVSAWQPPPAGVAGPVAPLAAPASLHVFRLDLEVLWSAAGHHYTAHFSTLRLGTPQEQPAPGAGA